MTEMQLLEAMGHLGEESLTCAAENRPGKKGFVRKTVLVAAMVSVFVLTAVAAKEYLWKLGEGKADKEPEGTVYTHNNGVLVVLPEQDNLAVYIDQMVLPNAAGYIETAYVPSVMKDDRLWSGGYGEGDGKLMDFALGWKVAGCSRFEEVELIQIPGGRYDPEKPIETIYSYPSGTPYTTEKFLWGEQEYLLFTFEMEEPDPDFNVANQYLYWTDSTYIFRLKFPEWMALEDARKIAESLAPVEDPKSYTEKVKESNLKLSQEIWNGILEEYSSDEEYVLRTELNEGWIETTESNLAVIRMSVTPDADAPEYIQRIIYPKLDGVVQHGPTESSTDKNSVQFVSFWWDVPQYGEREFIRFEQRRIGQDSDRVLVDFVSDAPSLDAIQGEVVELGGYRFYQVTYPWNVGEGYSDGRKILSWSDGSYVYWLSCPVNLTDEDILTILNSMVGA